MCAAKLVAYVQGSRRSTVLAYRSTRTYSQVEQLGRPDDAEEEVDVLEHGHEHLVERRWRAHLHCVFTTFYRFAWLKLANALFSSTSFCQIFQDSPSHRIFDTCMKH